MGVAPSLQLMGSERIDLYSWAPGPAVPPYRNEEKRNITKHSTRRAKARVVCLLPIIYYPILPYDV
jgi:hypothetical protein